MTEFGPAVTSLQILQLDRDDLVAMSPEQLTKFALPALAVPSVPALCDHKDFSITSGMSKTEGGYVARFRIWCSACGQPFFFSGVSGQPSDVAPRVDMDGTQVHLPLGCYYGPVTSVDPL